MGNYKIGDEVVFIDELKHDELPRFYPPVGTIGVVGYIDEADDLWIQWEEGSTSDGDYWCSDAEWVKHRDQ